MPVWRRIKKDYEPKHLRGGPKPTPPPEPEAAPEAPAPQVIELPFYRCANCTLHIEPDLVQRMESCGVNHEDVVIRHHCYCCPDENTFIHCRYDAVPEAIAYLFRYGEGFDHLHDVGGGGWYYENPLPRHFIHDHHWAMWQIRADIENCDGVDAFLRLCEG